MNAIHLVLLALLAPIVLLYRRPRLALRYARALALGLACIVVLAPFYWLVAAVFKDKRVFKENVFFPPLREWSTKTINLDNFVQLFRGGKRGSAGTISSGTISFWQYVLNSTVYATVGTVVQLF